MRLCVIIPALNEEATLGTVIDHILAVKQPHEVTETRVVVIDDGSTDQTASIGGSHGADVVRHAENRGLGVAFQTGIKKALEGGADLLVNIDADGQFDPADIPRLLQPLLCGRADFVTASRFSGGEAPAGISSVKLWGNRQMSRLVSMIVGRRFADVSCGFRAYTRDAAMRLNLWGDFTYTQESFLDISAKGLRIAEVPVSVRGEREFGDSRVANNVWVYAMRTSRILLRAFRDYWPLRFFGLLAALTALPGLGLWIFLLLHYLRSQRLSPHLWAGFFGGAFLLLSLLCLLTGLLGSMLKRIRLNQEEILYLLRKSDHAGNGKQE